MLQGYSSRKCVDDSNDDVGSSSAHGRSVVDLENGTTVEAIPIVTQSIPSTAYTTSSAPASVQLHITHSVQNSSDRDYRRSSRDVPSSSRAASPGLTSTRSPQRYSYRSYIMDRLSRTATRPPAPPVPLINTSTAPSTLSTSRYDDSSLILIIAGMFAVFSLVHLSSVFVLAECFSDRYPVYVRSENNYKTMEKAYYEKLISKQYPVDSVKCYGYKYPVCSVEYRNPTTNSTTTVLSELRYDKHYLDLFYRHHICIYQHEGLPFRG